VRLDGAKAALRDLKRRCNWRETGPQNQMAEPLSNLCRLPRQAGLVNGVLQTFPSLTVSQEKLGACSSAAGALPEASDQLVAQPMT